MVDDVIYYRGPEEDANLVDFHEELDMFLVQVDLDHLDMEELNDFLVVLEPEEYDRRFN